VDLIVCEFVFIILLISMRRIIHFIFFIQCSLTFPLDSLLGHDFLHVYKIISVRR